jgi:tRNA A-37 threonylcarbamoyl transferase component Bud32
MDRGWSAPFNLAAGASGTCALPVAAHIVILGWMAPTRIGRYEIRSELGRGGMATVYRAYDPSFEREVAIKVLPRELMHDPQFSERFRREMKMIASLEHPAIVPVYDMGEEAGEPYFVMRYMPGGSLTQWIEKGRLSLQDAARIIERLSSALAYAHRNGLVHRDLKPDNILFDNDGDPFISDFGVAKITDASTSMTGSGIIGTPAYMSPEQAQGEAIDNRSDIYGLGVIIFQMLSGHQPYQASTPMGVAVKQVTEPVPDILKINPSLPKQADTIIKTAMAKDPALRYQTATELAQALGEAAFGKEWTAERGREAGTLPTIVGSRAVHAQTTAGGRRRGLYIAGGAAVVVILVAGGVLGAKMLTPPPVPTATTTKPAPTQTALVVTATAPPTEPAPATAAYAPVCAPGVIPEPILPAIGQPSSFCNKGYSVTQFTIPLGATFVPQEEGYICDPYGQPGGQQLIACHGKNLTTFHLQVCIPLPTPSTSNVVGACQSGTEYDYDHACCAPPKPADAGCTIVKVDLGACQ